MNVLVLTSCFVWIAKTYVTLLTWLFKPPVHKKRTGSIFTSLWVKYFTLEFRIYLQKSCVLFCKKTRVLHSVVLLHKDWPESVPQAISSLCQDFYALKFLRNIIEIVPFYCISCIERILGYRCYLVSLESWTADF